MHAIASFPAPRGTAKEHVPGRRYARALALLVCAASLGTVSPAIAQSYPNKPVRIVIPFPAAGGTDTVARVMAKQMSESTGKQFYIDNRPGAGGNIAYDAVARSAPDGYTLLLSTTGIAVNPTLYKKIPYKMEDFTAITLIGRAPMVFVVNPKLPVHSMQELIAYAKQRPGQVRFGAPTGAAGYLAMEVFRTMTGIDIQHVPYKGADQALIDTIGGQIEMTSLAVPGTMPLVRSNKLRPLAQTGEKRSPGIADIPTVAEAGVKGYAVTTWYVMFGPAGMPAEVIAKLNTEVAKAIKTPEVQKQLVAAGLGEIIGSSPREAQQFVDAETARWATVLKNSGIKLE